MSSVKKVEVSRRKLSLALFSVALVFSLLSGSIMYAVAQGGSGTFTISSGVYPGAPSYTIYTDGAGMYYAKDAYGVVSWSSTNASYIITTAWSNGNIHLKDGTYYLTQAIFPLTSGYSLVGESRDKTIITVASGTPDNWGIYHKLIEVPPTSTVSNITISTLTLDANALGLSYVVQDLAILNVHQGNVIDNIRFKGIDGLNNCPLDLSQGVYDKVQNCIFDANGIEGGVENAQIYLHYTNFSQIINNIIFSSVREGIYVDAGSIGNVFQGNIISNILQEGIDFKDTAHQNTVIGNSFLNCVNAIYIESDENVINGNHFLNGTNGIVLAASTPSKNVITGNNINGKGSLTNNGIFLSTGATYNTLTGNTITNCDKGIFIYNTNHNTVTGNTCTDNGENIWITDSLSNVISGCTTQGGSYGIYEDGTSDYNIIVGCYSYWSGQNIKSTGVNTKVNLCYNGTAWIS